MSTAPISSTPSAAPAPSVATSTSNSSSTSASNSTNSLGATSATASSGDTVSISDAANTLSTSEANSNATTSAQTNQIVDYQFDSGTTVSVYQTITETVTKGIAKTGHALIDEMNQRLIERYEEHFGKEYTEKTSETTYSATITNADGSTETIELVGDMIFSEDEHGNLIIRQHQSNEGDLRDSDTDDLIISTSNNLNIRASGGNDTYIIAGANTSVDLGETNSTIYGYGVNTSIEGGDGTHNIEGKILNVELGNGDNAIKASVHNLKLGNGNNTINGYIHNAIIGDGNNTLEGVLYDAVIGDGNNSFIGNTHTFKIGNGDNTLVFNSVSMNHTSIHLGNGHNNMTIKNFESSFAEHVNVQMGDGKPLGIYAFSYGKNTKLFYNGVDLIARHREIEQRRYDAMKKRLEEEDPEELQKRIEEDRQKQRQLAKAFFDNSLEMFESLIERIESKAGFDRDTIDKEAMQLLAQSGNFIASAGDDFLTKEEAEHLKTLSKELHASYEKVYGEKIYSRINQFYA